MDDIEQQQRQAVITEAWSWIGTPFRHQSSVKGSAVDCAMLMAEIFTRTGIVEPFDPRPYHRLWFLHKDQELYLGWLYKFAEEIPAEEAKPGDIVIYKHGLCFSHAGLIVDETRLIHAWFKEDRVSLCERFTVELTHYGRETPRLCGQPRPVKYFDPWKKKRAAIA